MGLLMGRVHNISGEGKMINLVWSRTRCFVCSQLPLYFSECTGCG